MHNLFLVYFVKLGFSGLSRPIIRRHNRMYTNIGTYYSFQKTVCFPGWIGTLEYSNPTRTTDSLLKRINTNCCILTFVPPDDGPRYARNMQRLTKYIKNKLCIKLVFLHKVIEFCFEKTMTDKSQLLKISQSYVDMNRIC